MPRPSYIGIPIREVATPSLLVDKMAFITNCQRMLKRAKEEMGVELRGQTKTHKTVEGAVIQTGGTKRGLVVSTLMEAEMYADAGFDDILYGYPLLPVDMDRNFQLSKRLDAYHVMVNNVEGAKCLIDNAPPEGKKWSAFLKVDVGYARAGVSHTDEKCLEIAKMLSDENSRVDFQGLYVHCGNSYKSNSVEGVQEVRDNSIIALSETAKRMREAGIVVKRQGIGSTPSCSHQSGSQQQTGLTEIHPGNYVFYDLQQLMLGSCTEEDIAAVVVTRVIGHFPGERNQLLIDAGFTALSEQGFNQLGGTFAIIKDHSNLQVVGMTQEIGFVQPKSGPINFEDFPIGSMLYLLQYHSCDTAANFPVYYVHENGIVTEEWIPTRGW